MKQTINKKLQQALVKSDIYSNDVSYWLRNSATRLRREMKKLGLIIKEDHEKTR